MRSRGGGWRIYGGMGVGHTRLPPPDDTRRLRMVGGLRPAPPSSSGLSRRLHLGLG